MDFLDRAQGLADEAYGATPSGSTLEMLAEALQALIEEVRNLRSRVAALDGGEGAL